MLRNSLIPRRAVVSSAALVFVLSAASAANASTEIDIPTRPEECSNIERWLPNSGKAYQPGSCVYSGKYVWTNEERANASQEPGRGSRVWYRIGAHTLDDLNVTVAANANAQPVVFTYTVEPPRTNTRVQFVAKRVDTSREAAAFPRDGYTLLRVMAFKDDLGTGGGTTYPVWLRAQRITAGSGLDGQRAPLDAIGGEMGGGSVIVWYDPADNEALVPGSRYRTRSSLRLKVDAHGTDIPRQPAVGSFRLGIDIVHQKPSQ